MTDRIRYSDFPPEPVTGGFLPFALKFALFGGLAIAALTLSTMLLPLAALALLGWLVWAGLSGAIVAGPGVRAVALVVFAGLLVAFAVSLLPLVALGIAGYIGWRLLSGAGRSGNGAFDAYRDGEFSRMDREESDFDAYRDRMAAGRDRGEFDRFMADRERRRGYDIEGTAERL